MRGLDRDVRLMKTIRETALQAGMCRASSLRGMRTRFARLLVSCRSSAGRSELTGEIEKTEGVSSQTITFGKSAVPGTGDSIQS